MRNHASERGSGVVWILTVLAVVIIAIIGWVTYRHHHTPITLLPANCQQKELNLSIGPSNGTAGTIYVDAVFTNQGSRTCTLNGYPSASLTDNHNTMIGIAAAQNTSFPATTVTLHPGDSAHAAMGFPEPANFGPGVCSGNSTNLRITPPNLNSSLETPLARQSCPGFSITAVQPGL